MENCCSKRQACDSVPPLNEHSHIQRHFRVGVVGEKTNDGEIHVGLKSTIDTKRDREFSPITNSLPSILEVIGDNTSPATPQQ